MSFLSVISGIFSAVKSVRAISDFIDKTYQLWIDEKIKNLDLEQHNILQQRKILIKSISEAEDDESRQTLSVVLSSIC